mmetsp:Transcript_31415/g.57040  ORF Transcript_31415/g.57040 Transcript_31415/m.57040 type:complete len:382 (-) Transcript_31415:444-1589(-)
MNAIQSYATDAYNAATEQLNKLSATEKAIAAVVGGSASLYLFCSLCSNKKLKPSASQLTGGSISSKAVKQEFKDYSDSYSSEAGVGITDRSKTVHLVDIFYSLVTDIYEWGWGQSFHFSPRLPHKDIKASEAAHEARIAATLGLKPGMKALDVGCGVGGPMRTIASTSGAKVTGITINQYQVDRANFLNKAQGVDSLAEVVRGDFLNMPFESNSFDGAYAIEATCHAPKLHLVYQEVFRVLKPGSYFVSYEWVSTKDYDAKNPEHVKIMDEINFGNGLPEMRTWLEAEEAGKTVGFELVRSLDLATSSTVAGPWYDRLKMGRFTHAFNHCIVSTLDFLHIAPKGLKDVHKMLVDVAQSLVAGGRTNIFTPMHMLVFKKPEA